MLGSLGASAAAMVDTSPSHKEAWSDVSMGGFALSFGFRIWAVTKAVRASRRLSQLEAERVNTNRRLNRLALETIDDPDGRGPVRQQIRQQLEDPWLQKQLAPRSRKRVQQALERKLLRRRKIVTEGVPKKPTQSIFNKLQGNQQSGTLGMGTKSVDLNQSLSSSFEGEMRQKSIHSQKSIRSLQKKD